MGMSSAAAERLLQSVWGLCVRNGNVPVGTPRSFRTQLIPRRSHVAGPTDAPKSVSFALARARGAERGRVVLDAPRALLRPLSGLLRELAMQPPASDEELRLVAGAADARRLADALTAPLAQLASDARRTPAWSGQVVPAAFQVEDDQALRAVGADAETGDPGSAEVPPPQDATQPAEPGPAQGLQPLPRLRNSVSVHAIEDLGMLLLRGDEADVAAVEQLVRQIERLGLGTAPDIHLLYLTQVDSLALAKVLTSVFERAALPERAVTVLPVVEPNAIVIVAPEAEIQAVIELAGQLDEPTPPGSQLRIFPLADATAVDLLKTLEELLAAQDGLSMRIHAVADVRTDSLIVQGAPRDLIAVEGLIRRLDRGDSQAVSQIRVFPLKNAVAEDLAKVMNESMQSILSETPGVLRGGGLATSGAAAGAVPGAAAGAGTSARSVVLQFLTDRNGSERWVRSGLLEDVRVTFDARINALVVTAPERSMEMMAALIERLDAPSRLVADVKVFPLENADAGAMARLLESMFGNRTTAGGPRPLAGAPSAG